MSWLWRDAIQCGKAPDGAGLTQSERKHYHVIFLAPDVGELVLTQLLIRGSQTCAFPVVRLVGQPERLGFFKVARVDGEENASVFTRLIVLNAKLTEVRPLKIMTQCER